MPCLPWSVTPQRLKWMWTTTTTTPRPLPLAGFHRLHLRRQVPLRRRRSETWLLLLLGYNWLPEMETTSRARRRRWRPRCQKQALSFFYIWCVLRSAVHVRTISTQLRSVALRMTADAPYSSREVLGEWMWSGDDFLADDILTGAVGITTRHTERRSHATSPNCVFPQTAQAVWGCQRAE